MYGQYTVYRQGANSLSIVGRLSMLLEVSLYLCRWKNRGGRGKGERGNEEGEGEK